MTKTGDKRVLRVSLPLLMAAMLAACAGTSPVHPDADRLGAIADYHFDAYLSYEAQLRATQLAAASNEGNVTSGESKANGSRAAGSEDDYVVDFMLPFCPPEPGFE